MSKFKKGSNRPKGSISTASLPDIVFMLLFFFMTVTVLRTEDEKVQVTRPEASELYKVEKKHLIRYINIGTPMDKRYGTEPVIQLNDQFSHAYEVRDWIAKERKTLAESEQSKMWVSLKVDQETKMGIVSAVKQELRQASALKVLYSATSRSRTGSEE
ncbi:MAG TPA: biopolymer transporter ExbD [Flavobacteriales bacterium]|jgi:biopolymer transport protein ExbD|nr:biopolymer transporter ExbD [Flavobacteriales bacterium]HHZ96285.1 biopolymer transporter ExbD [Flavobacteriales bacterium]HIB77561.1 biopolymer transporter ExbD [Flavobacteriales bacterium]HIN41764.1 biopolymer transporter ExbD [Flavobacteriales bacterium]HIO16133.1 biopolymer transporter ExbD [Flavobacteriales bacterium]